METKSKVILSIVGLVIVGAVVSKLLAPTTLPDTVQIENQLQAISAAANDKNPAGLMSIISDSYSDSEVSNAQQLSLLIQRGIQNVRNLTVTIGPAKITVNGDTAVSTVFVIAVADGQTISNQSITCTWRKESTRRYFIIPDKTWRVVHTNYAGSLGED